MGRLAQVPRLHAVDLSAIAGHDVVVPPCLSRSASAKARYPPRSRAERGRRRGVRLGPTRGYHRMLIRRRREACRAFSEAAVVIAAKSAGRKVFGLATAGVCLA
jgi:hypothetical protein